MLQAIRSCVTTGKFLDTRHGADRKNERKISRAEIVHILLHGWHVPRRDRYEEGYGEYGWSYVVEGRTVKERNLRVVVAFDETTGALIVSAVDLDTED